MERRPAGRMPDGAMARMLDTSSAAIRKRRLRRRKRPGVDVLHNVKYGSAAYRHMLNQGEGPSIPVIPGDGAKAASLRVSSTVQSAASSTEAQSF